MAKMESATEVDWSWVFEVIFFGVVRDIRVFCAILGVLLRLREGRLHYLGLQPGCRHVLRATVLSGARSGT